MTDLSGALPLLLADRSPALRWRALVEVEGLGDDDAEVAELARAVPSSASGSAAFAAVEETPRGLGYALARAAHVGLGADDQRVGAVAERLFAMQARDGSWPLARSDAEGYQWIPLQTAIPLRGLAAAGYATDPRAERGYEWLLARRLDDGSWPTGVAAGARGRVAGYRRIPRSDGCRTNTTGAVASLVHHPSLRTSGEARQALDLLLQRETRDEWALGFEVARLLGVEPLRGLITFYARFDLALVLDLASRAGASAADERVADLVAFLDERRGPYGLWEHPSHPQLSRWLTLDLLSSMRRLSAGDWAGRDLRVSFRAYPRVRSRN